ncbi:MAG: hypothetical protein ABI763_06795 [Bacteroidota bacterium]
MLKYFFKVAGRNIQQNIVNNFINIARPGIGMASVILTAFLHPGCIAVHHYFKNCDVLKNRINKNLA